MVVVKRLATLSNRLSPTSTPSRSFISFRLSIEIWHKAAAWSFFFCSGRFESIACTKDLRVRKCVSSSRVTWSSTSPCILFTMPNKARSTALAALGSSIFKVPRRRYIATCCIVRVDTLWPFWSTNTNGSLSSPIQTRLTGKGFGVLAFMTKRSPTASARTRSNHLFHSGGSCFFRLEVSVAEKSLLRRSCKIFCCSILAWTTPSIFSW